MLLCSYTLSTNAPHMKQPAYIRTSVVIRSDQRKALRRLWAAKRLSASAIVRDALDAWLLELKKPGA